MNIYVTAGVYEIYTKDLSKNTKSDIAMPRMRLDGE